jgi:hypothetical protein
MDQFLLTPQRPGMTGLLCNEVDVPSAQPLEPRMKLTLILGLRMALVALMIVSPAGYSQTVPTCKLPDNAVSISQPGASHPRL